MGLWPYYRFAPDGGPRQLTQVYDHSAGQLLYAAPDANYYQTETAPGTWATAQLTQAPWFVGGEAALAAFTSSWLTPKPLSRPTRKAKYW